jgi:hypothetical protein
MELLYLGRYRARFFPVCRLIRGESVTELCFGDTLIADFCRKKKILWTGLDINVNFVRHALSLGHNAVAQDISKVSHFPKADTLIMCGALYHFHDELEHMFSRMLEASPYIIISEPVINLSAGNGIIGKLAKGSAGIQGEEHDFRFNEQMLLHRLKELSEKLNFKFSKHERFSKDLIIVIER